MLARLLSLRTIAFAVALSACGGGASVADSIETYCTDQAATPALRPYDTSTCSWTYSDAEGTFCGCSTAADCPTGLACARLDSALWPSPGGIGIVTSACVMPGDCGIRPVPVSECVSQYETMRSNAISQRCTTQFQELITCLAAMGPFCDAAARDAACGVEAGRLSACRSGG